MPGNRQQFFSFYRGRTPGKNIGAFFFGGCVEGFGFEWLCVASGFIALRAFICSQAFASWCRNSPTIISWLTVTNVRFLEVHLHLPGLDFSRPKATTATLH